MIDFAIIGAQKAGTTALWRYLEDNPRLRMPASKEAPFFVEPAYPADLRSYMRALFKDAPFGAKLGTVTPAYMVGVPGAPVNEVARRIHGVVPELRLIALLRDPVARARSAHGMLVRRGVERRTFAQAVAEQLEPSQLDRSRRVPEETQSYVTAGEYGRILAAYRERFPQEQLHVELTSDLDRDPVGVVARICRFIGVDEHVPRHAGRRFHVSGPRRVSPAAETDLKEYMASHVWPRMRHAEQHRASFDRFFELWNVEPDKSAASDPPTDGQLAAMLRAHYAEDARTLEAVTGLRIAWAGESERT